MIDSWNRMNRRDSRRHEWYLPLIPKKKKGLIFSDVLSWLSFFKAINALDTFITIVFFTTLCQFSFLCMSHFHAIPLLARPSFYSSLFIKVQPLDRKDRQHCIEYYKRPREAYLSHSCVIVQMRIPSRQLNYGSQYTSQYTSQEVCVCVYLGWKLLFMITLK
jgi:hypothetical protein